MRNKNKQKLGDHEQQYILITLNSEIVVEINPGNQ